MPENKNSNSALETQRELILNAKILKIRNDKLATAEVTCTVDGQVVSSAELMFTLVDGTASSEA